MILRCPWDTVSPRAAFEIYPGGRSWHTKSISPESSPLSMTPTPSTSCVLGKPQYIYQSSSVIKNVRGTEPTAASGDKEKITGFLKLSAG